MDCQRECYLRTCIAMAVEVELISSGWTTLGQPATCSTLTQLVEEEIPGQGRLESSYRMFAATHLIYGLKST